jgi:hypothetical protein
MERPWNPGDMTGSGYFRRCDGRNDEGKQVKSGWRKKRIAMTNNQRKPSSIGTADVRGIQEALEQMMPKSLDDIVRKNRDVLQLGLATAGELAVLAATIEPGHSRDTIEEWRIVAFRAIGPRSDADMAGILSRSLSLLGRAAGMRCPWITSAVTQIDIDAGLVRTRNSLYRLGARGEGEPPQDDLICVCAAMHKCGVGELIGAPAFFY